MKILIALLTFLVGFFSAMASAEEAPESNLTPEQQAIEQQTMAAIQLYYIKGCQACHGLQAEGVPSKNGPALAGLSDIYLTRQLKHFRDRVRGGTVNDLYGRQMTQAANSLTDDHIDLLAKLISGIQPRFVPQAMLSADIDNGKKLYQQYDCARCHGANGQGEDPAPRVAGQQDAYLALQLRNYQQRIRGGHASDPHGQQMAAFSQLLQSEQEIADVSAYMASLQVANFELTEFGDNRDVVLNYYARLDGGDKNAVYEVLSENLKFHVPDRTVYGHHNYWALVSQAGIYIPNFKHVLTDVRVDEQDPSLVHVGKVAVNGNTAAGEYKSFPAENARYKVVAGKIVEVWLN